MLINPLPSWKDRYTNAIIIYTIHGKYGRREIFDEFVRPELEIFREKGYKFYIESPTNQQFLVISNEEVERLERHVLFSHFGQTDHRHTICRFVTSWATTDEELDELQRILVTT